MDLDINKHTNLYSRVNGKPDPNIDFRRVPNQDVYFKSLCSILNDELISGRC